MIACGCRVVPVSCKAVVRSEVVKNSATFVFKESFREDQAPEIDFFTASPRTTTIFDDLDLLLRRLMISKTGERCREIPPDPSGESQPTRC